MKYTEWLTSGSHMILKQWCDSANKDFKKNANNLEASQRQILHSILQTSNLARKKDATTYEQFIKSFKSSRYSAWREEINQYREQKLSLSTSKLIRFQPTSGSSGQIKFIPYTQLFLDELDHAIAPWVASMYRK